jgi:AcrR family transcriptional regulator
MARVTQAHVEARTESILEAAGRVFGRKGFAGATMAEIAAEAGISAGAIYRYFPSKEDVIIAMSDEGLDRRRAIVEEIARRGGTLEVLTQLADTFFPQLEHREVFLNQCVELELASEATRNEKVRSALQRCDDMMIVPLANIIRDAQERGDINSHLNPESVARILLAMFEGLVLQVAVERRIDIRAYVEAMKAMIAGTFWTGPAWGKEHQA